MNRGFVITGIPRSGTSFVCELLNHLPDVVALNETMDISALLSATDAEARILALKDYFAQVRQGICRSRTVPQNELASSDGNMFLSETSVPRKSAKTGRLISVPVQQNLSRNFAIGLKNLNVFALLLSEFQAHFDCFAVVRNPLATLGSWHTLDHPVRSGRIVAAARIDPPLASRLAGIEDSRSRRLALLDWYHRRFIDVLGTDRIMRYEDILATNGRSLHTVFPSASSLPSLLEQPLQNHNRNPIYGRAFEAIADTEALLEDHKHACWEVYEPSEVRELLRMYKAGPVRRHPPRQASSH